MTPPGRAVSPLESLAPDQRAALELVVRQGRSYAQLAGLLGIPEDAVRDRARGALEALAPDLPPPAGAGELADFLLGQQDEAAAAETRAQLADDAAAQRWVMTVGAPLGELAPAAPPPAAPLEDIELPARRPAPAQVPAPAAAAAAAAAAPAAAEPARTQAAPVGRSSRLGGAILIGAVVLVVAAVLVFVLTRGHHSPTPAAQTSPTATATANPDQLGPGDVVLRGPAGSKAVGLMRLFTTKDKNVHFLLAGQGLPPNPKGQQYTLWFERKGRAPLKLGRARFAVGKDGALAMSGPPTADLKRFPTWFTTYDTVQVTADASPGARRPGAAVLSGNLPRSG